MAAADCCCATFRASAKAVIAPPSSVAKVTATTRSRLTAKQRQQRYRVLSPVTLAAHFHRIWRLGFSHNDRQRLGPYQ